MKNVPIFLLFLSIPFVSSAQLWSKFGTPNGNPRCMYVDSIDNSLYVGGGFATINGEIIRGIGKWDGTSWDDLDIGMDVYNIPGSPNNVLAITKFKEEIIVAGAFTTAGDINSKYISRWNGSSWLPFNGQPNEAVLDVMVYNDMLYVCGVFDSLGSVPSNGVGRWDGENWHDVGEFQNYYLNPSTNNYMYTLKEYQGNIYVSGTMEDSLQNTHHLAWFDGSNWHYFADDLKGAFAGGWALEVFNNELYVAGDIEIASGNYGNAIQRWNGTTWNSVGMGMGGVNTIIWELKVWDEKLYAVGAFTEAGGVPANKVTYWDGVRWCGFGSDFDGDVSTLEFYDGIMHIGGGFKIIDEDSIIYLAKWIGGEYVDSCSTPVGINEPVHTILDFTMYPNPAHDDISITCTKSINGIRIFDLLGKEVLSCADIDSVTSPIKQINIDVSQFINGVYVVEIQAEGVKSISKMIKN